MKHLLVVGLLICGLFTVSCQRLITGLQGVEIDDILIDNHSNDDNPGVAGKCTLFVSVDNTNQQCNRDNFIVGGMTSDFLMAVKLRATQFMEIREFGILTTNQAIDETGGTVRGHTTSSLFSKFYLVGADKSYILSTTSEIGMNTVFKNVSTFEGTTTVYLRADVNSIGKDQPGQIDACVSFCAEKIRAYCDGKEVVVIYEDNPKREMTDESKKLGITALKISNIELVNFAGGKAIDTKISGSGWYHAAIIKVTTDTDGENTTASGDEIKLFIDSIQIGLRKNPKTNIDEIRLTRLGKSSSEYIAKESSSEQPIFDLTVGMSTDREISASDVAYFMVKVHIDVLDDSENDWFEVYLGDLDGHHYTANIYWRDGDDAGIKHPLWLKFNSVDGTKISE